MPTPTSSVVPPLPSGWLVRTLSILLDENDLNHTLDALASLCNVPTSALKTGDVMVPLAWFEQWLQHPSRSPAWMGWQVGSHAGLTSQGAISVLLMTAPTVREAARLVSRYYGLVTDILSFEFHELQDSGVMLVNVHSDCAAAVQFLECYLAGVMCRLSELTLGGQAQGWFEMTQSRPADMPPAFERAAMRWVFDAPVICGHWPNQYLDLPGLFSDPFAHASAKLHCDKLLLQRTQAQTIIARIKTLLQRQAGGYLSQDDMAGQLHMSVSTLKRELAACGTSFSAQLEQVKRQHALVLLRNQNLSLGQIADRLGYSDPSNFTHAFKRWFGTAPSAFRVYPFSDCEYGRPSPDRSIVPPDRSRA